MKQPILYALFAAALMTACNSSEKTPIELADPMVGTGFHGHTFPGATTPHGAVQLSPDTRAANWDACSGYHYSDSTLTGFSHTHLSGTGCNDLGDIMIRPDGDTQPIPFDHSRETATPGYYSVSLPSVGVEAELTATPHAGVHRYTYNGVTPTITIDLGHSTNHDRLDSMAIAITGPAQVSGMRESTGWAEHHQVYFVAQFSAPIASDTMRGDTAMILTFNTTGPLVVKVGLSGVSEANALENLNAEVPDFDFDATLARTRTLWEDALGAITVKGGTETQRRNFYSALYHCNIAPYNITDVNGQYRRMDHTVATAPEGHPRYSTFSLWDTYRAWHPLMTLVDTVLVNDMVNSMIDMYDASGELPIWPLADTETRCMIGYHAISAIADAYNKGIRGYDAEHALDAMINSSDINKKGSAEYISMGFIPANRTREAVSCHLEYAYDDWCIYTMAQALGRDLPEYRDRAESYANVMDGTTGFFRGRRDDGGRVDPFHPRAVDRSLTEATPWQYRFYVPHDVNGMIDMMGGREAFIAALDTLFTTSSEIIGDLSDITGMVGQYAHGNEPSHHIAYLYNYVGQPWKTQEMTRRLLDEMYTPTPEGIIGNEDCGQMSAWYVMTALGLYPVCPGSGEYALTSPLFDEAVVKLAGDKTLTIKANNPGRNKYIKSVTFNGRVIDTNFITHNELTQGGILDFTLTDKPVLDRGTTPEAAPYSLNNVERVSTPFIEEDLFLFIDSTTVTMGCLTDGAEIRYTTDGSAVTGESPLYTGSFVISRSCPVKIRAFKQDATPSVEVTVTARRADMKPAMTLATTQPGIKYTYHEGLMERTADITRYPALESGIITEPSIAGARLDDHFGYTFTGYIDVPVDGVYTFFTRSDDGSVLFIDGEKVVDNDGGHAPITSSGAITLRKGLHPFRLLYFEDYEGEEFSWGWALPGATAPEAIPASALSH